MAHTTIDRATAHRRGEVLFTGLYELAGHKLRIRIRCDDYPTQCYAVAEVLTGNGWAELHSLVAPAVAPANPYSEVKTRQAVDADEAELLRLAAKLLPLPNKEV